MRKIIHIDMDAFYASVEQRDNPKLRYKPIAVGGSSSRGVVAAASYEARKYGVRSAMASRIAIAKCPKLIFVRPRFDVYKKVSQQIRAIFHEYTDLVEPLSLDEAFLDVTTNKMEMPSATLIAKEIRSRILKETSLTASAGISMNKFLAKTASDVNKPDGLFLIHPKDAIAYVEKLPIERFFGVGKITAQKMHDLGVKNGYDLKQLSENDLVKQFGKVGHYYFKIARAEDDRAVNPNRIRKSLGAENTYADDLKSNEEIVGELERITEELVRRMKKSNSKGKTLTLKVKYSDFKQITRSKTMADWIVSHHQIEEIYLLLVDDIPLRDGVRLLGLTVSNLNHEQKQKEPADAPKSQLTFDF